MSKIPTVSIVFPVYNAIRFLEEAVRSVFAQSLTDWELIAVDDASTDGSWEYLQRIDDSRVRLARNDRNRRHPVTVNRAIDMARGKWIARMDADDIIFPERLERQVNALEANPAIDVLGCGTIQTDLNLNPVTTRRPVTDDAAIKRMPTIRYPMTYGALVGKTEWWQRWHVDPRALLSTSFDLYLRSYRESTFGNVQDLLYVYRYVGHTRTFRKQTLAVWDRAKSLMRNGFHRGMIAKTFLGLVTLAPRPLAYGIKTFTKSYTAIVPAEGEEVINEEDARLLRDRLAEVAAVEVPLRGQP
ncbi:MAG: glycosyltransferase family 2 protein [Phycisphaerae bacterium]|nr:glycosyltransferase family 2 protein [Phycisphaerae bacterium]